MSLFLRFTLVWLGLTAAAGAADAPAALHYKVVLIAGDWSAAAFDHATAAMQERLLNRQVAPGDLQRLSAAWWRDRPGMGCSHPHWATYWRPSSICIRVQAKVASSSQRRTVPMVRDLCLSHRRIF